ncbi:hypothetical protein BJ684DRAFT_21196 [Piptocephalis cylindrospora]|uniref:Cystathionine gamma-synthase n=1 Tax=Piptocephalis cylindrospora TaxID=1907219 RepID=A0A4P9Y2H0_9FUNG|nr:hypothetical protein BJ684DRAFT_21196 [Piptocephalis cylindrospora]|eukprot:RKP12251.1 hypothetical protein BJ684DRAFT_21196 [Piptocephalis cylindrospora]
MSWPGGTSMTHPSPTTSAPPTPEPGTTKEFRKATDFVLTDHGENGILDPYRASSLPIYQTATFKQVSATEGGAYDYTRSGNPTRSHVGECEFI